MPIIPGVSASSDGRQPTEPIIGTATAGSESASVVFTGPSYLGKPGDNNLYVATSSPGSITGSSTSSPISVTSLSNGTSYTFTVVAQTRNSNNSVIATSLPSSASNSVTPAALPPSFPPPFPPPFPPSFPPKFSVKCIHSKSQVLTKLGYVNAEDIKVGDKILTVDASSLTNTETLKNMTILDNVKFVEVEVLVNNVDQKPLIKFNNSDNMFSLNQPIFVKNGDVIDWKHTGEIIVGDILVDVDTESGNISYTPVEKIETLEQDNVHEIRTSPHLWFIVGNYLVVS